jgi:hypothetical protein
MPGSFPQYSDIYPELATLLARRGGNNSPVGGASGGGVSGLSTWIRLISSVDGGLVMESIHDSTRGDLFSTNYGGSGLYKGSGILGHNFAGSQVWIKSGIDRALRPSPIITGMTMDEKAEGGSRLAKISITAFTLKQAETLSEYFLEPGFHLLCEWGWNTRQSVSQKCGGGGKLDVCDIVQYDNWPHVKTKREKSGYQYDAFLGIVTGGGISFGDNETYTLEIQVTSVGNVAEYMQTHRDANSTDTAKKDSSGTFSAQEVDSAVGGGKVGRALFMQMFNELPGHKRTPLVKQLINNAAFSNEGNFVNIDKVVKEELMDTLSEAGELTSDDSSSDAEVSIPKDMPLIVEDRFIRFELAVEIINSYPMKLSPQKSACSKQSRDQRINIRETVCGGFPHMFSTDKSKLFIPNTTAPNFNLKKALSSTEETTDFIVFNDLNAEANLANLHPSTGNTVFTGNQNGDKKDFATGQSRPAPYAFPATYGLKKTFGKVDSSFEPIIEKPYFWGYLRNLYINFDFFVECISKPNFVVRDVFYEMLNGMSSACNSFWKFQIIERPNKDTGDLELGVVDLNFGGIVGTDGITRLQARGVTSPFVSCDFSVEVPGAMMSSIVQKKLNSKFEHSPELNPRPMLGNVFSKREDKAGTILQGLKEIEEEQEVEKDTNTPTQEKSAEELEQDARALNYEYYTKTGAVLPKIQDRLGEIDLKKEWYDFVSSNDGSIERTLMVGAWNDTAALRQVFLVDKGIATGGKSGRSAKDNNNNNPPFGVASFNFRVHGVSGFKVGDKFRVDGVPKQFDAPNFFQIVKVDHNIEGMNWWTDVKGELRVIGGDK